MICDDNDYIFELNLMFGIIIEKFLNGEKNESRPNC